MSVLAGRPYGIPASTPGRRWQIDTLVALRSASMERELLLQKKAEEALGLVARARVLESQGQCEEAAILLATAMKEYAHLPSQWAKAAALYSKAKKPVAAIQAAATDLLIRPDNLEALEVILLNKEHLQSADLGGDDSPPVRVMMRLCEILTKRLAAAKEVSTCEHR